MLEIIEKLFPLPLFWVKKEKLAEGKKARRASKKTSLPPPPLGQGLDASPFQTQQLKVC